MSDAASVIAIIAAGITAAIGISWRKRHVYDEVDEPEDDPMDYHRNTDNDASPDPDA